MSYECKECRGKGLTISMPDGHEIECPSCEGAGVEVDSEQLASLIKLEKLLRKRIKLYKDSPLDHPNDLQMNWRVQEEIYATLCGFLKEAGLE